MLGGKLIRKSRKTVDGSYRQHSYTDTWQDTIDIDYTGELTNDVQSAITKAFYNSNLYTKGSSGSGALRWSIADRVIGIDVEKRQLVLECGCGIAD